jgi:cytochrome c-type biogenesis protein
VVDAPNLLLAFAAGLVSFLSPCCLPLVPGYLAAVTGTNAAAPASRETAQVLGRSLLFVGTFSLLFVLLGLGATLAGQVLTDNQPLLNTLAGSMIVAMGLLLIASVLVVRLNRSFRPSGLLERAGRGGPVVAGAAFAIAWTPCVGPTLGAILGLAATQQGTARGAGLLGVYSAGLALPFLISAMAFTRAMRAFAVLKRHHVALQLGAGIVLTGMGALVLSDELFRLNAEAQRFLDRLGLNVFQSV